MQRGEENSVQRRGSIIIAVAALLSASGCASSTSTATPTTTTDERTEIAGLDATRDTTFKTTTSRRGSGTTRPVNSSAPTTARPPVATSTTRSAGTVLPPATTAAPAALGVTFRDPQGGYTTRIGADWVETSGIVAKEIESWTVAPPRGGFSANVNILTQLTQGLDLDQYLYFSTANMGGYTLIDQSKVQGTNGNTLGRIEYAGQASTPVGAKSLHFLAFVDVRNGQAVVETLTAEEDAFASLRTTAEPLMLGLQAG